MTSSAMVVAITKHGASTFVADQHPHIYERSTGQVPRYVVLCIDAETGRTAALSGDGALSSRRLTRSCGWLDPGGTGTRPVFTDLVASHHQLHWLGTLFKTWYFISKWTILFLEYSLKY